MSVLADAKDHGRWLTAMRAVTSGQPSERDKEIVSMVVNIRMNGERSAVNALARHRAWVRAGVDLSAAPPHVGRDGRLFAGHGARVLACRSRGHWL